MQVNFPKTVSGSLCSISLVVQTNYCISCLDGELHAGGAVIVRPVGCTAKFSKRTPKTVNGSEMNSCRPHANCRLLQNL